MPEELGETRIGVFVVAESTILRQGILSVISKNDDMEVVGQAGGKGERFSITGDFVPRTVALLAIDPRGSLHMVYELKEVSPDVPTIVMAEYYNDDGLFQAILAGASAFITTRSPSEQVLDTIRRVYHKERMIIQNVLERPQVALRIMEHFQQLSSVKDGLGLLLATLSPMEEHILHLIADGESVGTMATSLNTSKQEINTRVGSVLYKLDVNERTSKVIRKLRRGFGESSPIGTNEYRSS